MKYTVSIANKSFEVEVEDVHARPIIARVDGECFEVQPDSVDIIQAAGSTKVDKPVETQVLPVYRIATPNQLMNGNELMAPLPGTVVEIFVKHGDDVETGNVLLVIEAMKMKNSIRSTRSGKVSEILVSVGQTVAHKQSLVRFA
jgi:biotin carboxyl carrier protein